MNNSVSRFVIPSVLLCGLLSSSVLAADVPHKVISDQPRPMSADPKHWWWRCVDYRDNEAKQLRDADVVWLGDSITHYFDNPGPKNELWKKYFGGKENGAPYLGLNFGIEGDTTENLIAPRLGGIVFCWRFSERGRR